MRRGWRTRGSIAMGVVACSQFCTSDAMQHSLYSSVAERQSCKLKVLGSIPSGGCAASTLQVAMHGGTVNTCVSLAVLIAFLKRRWSCPPASKCAVLSLALGAQVPGAPPAGHRPSVTGRFSRAAPTPSMPVILCMVLGSVAHHLSPTHEALAVSAPFSIAHTCIEEGVCCCTCTN